MFGINSSTLDFLAYLNQKTNDKIKVNFLLFFAHGYSLTMENTSLLDEYFFVSENGPVFLDYLNNWNVVEEHKPQLHLTVVWLLDAVGEVFNEMNAEKMFGVIRGLDSWKFKDMENIKIKYDFERDSKVKELVDKIDMVYLEKIKNHRERIVAENVFDINAWIQAQ